MPRPFPSWRNLATVQVDIDSLDTICRGYCLDPGPQTGPDPVIREAVPRYLDLFRSFGVRATFFVVGRDLEREANLPLLQALLDAGHELANHSYCHVGFDTLSPADQEADMARCHALVEERLGRRCLGFKAPCYAVRPASISSLVRLGYAYDSSMIGTVLSPVIKTYYRLLLKKSIHPSNWGYFPHLFSPREPYRPDPERIWRRGSAPILEIPVTTFPALRIPFHFSFVNVMGPTFLRAYFALAGHMRRNFLNFAFHAVDLVPAEALPEALRSRPGLRRPHAWRMARAQEALAAMQRQYAVHPSAEVAEMAASA